MFELLATSSTRERQEISLLWSGADSVARSPPTFVHGLEFA